VSYSDISPIVLTSELKISIVRQSNVEVLWVYEYVVDLGHDTGGDLGQLHVGDLADEI
jgi:hypothetical protein